MKRNILLIISISITLIVSILLGVFFWPSKQNTANLINFIPSDALCIVESKQMHKLIQTNSANQSIAHFLFTNKIGAELNQLDSIFQYLPEYLQNTTESAFSVHELSGDFPLLFYLNFGKNNHLSQNKKILFQLLANHSKTKVKFENEEVDVISLQTNNLHLHIWTSGNILIASFNAGILNHAIHQFHLNKGINSDKNFAELQKTSGQNVDANVFINLNPTSPFFSANSKNLVLTLLSEVENEASWCALDYSTKDSTLIFNGFSSYLSNNIQYLSCLSKQNATAINIDSLLPNDTYRGSILNLSSINCFNANYKRYLQCNSLQERNNREISILDSNFRCDMYKSIYQQIKGIAVLIKKETNVSFVYENISLIQLKDPNILINKLESGRFPSTTIHPAANFELKTYTIPASDITGTLFGSMFSSNTLINFTVWNNWLIGSESNNSTEKYIKQILTKQTLEQDDKWNDQKQNLSGEYVIKTFIRPNKKNQTKQVKLFNYYCLQFAPQANLLYTSLFFHCKELAKPTEKKNVITASKLPSYSAPQHLNTGWFSDHYIAYTDTSIALFLPNGNLKWSCTVPEMPVGEVLEVDAFHNGKYQLLYTSDHYINLIDKNGKSISPFPLHINNKITGQVSWLKYPDNSDGRIFVPTETGVESYTNQCVKVVGLTPPSTKFAILDKVNYAVVNGKDILYFHNGHEWFFTNRQGKSLAQWPENVALPNHPSLFLSGDDKRRPCFIGTTKEGDFVSFQFGSKPIILKNKGISANHYFAQYSNNANNFYLITDKSKLLIYTSKLKKQIEFNLLANVIEFPQFYHFPINKDFIAFRLEKQAICLFNIHTNSIKNVNLDTFNSIFYPLSPNEGQILWVNKLSVIEKKSIK